MKRRIMPPLALLALTLTALPAIGYFELLAQREVYKALESVGVIEEGGSFWGQILRYNVPRHPHWMRTYIRVFSGSAAYAGVVVAIGAAVVTTLVSLGSSGSVLRGLRRHVPSLSAASLIFGLVLTLTYDRMDDLVFEGMYDLADALGCPYVNLSGMRPLVLGGHSPFHGEGAACALLNWFYLNGWPIAPLVVPALASGVTMWWLGPRQAAAGDDCAACGYPLVGLHGHRCPECGLEPAREPGSSKR